MLNELEILLWHTIIKRFPTSGLWCSIFIILSLALIWCKYCFIYLSLWS